MEEDEREAERLIAEVARKRGNHLELTGLRLSTVPESIRQLTNLTLLSLSGNQLTTLPAWIGQLTNLTKLSLNNNQISSFPESFTQLTNLTELQLDDNQLTVLPDSIQRLTKLTRLDLDNNQLTTIPEWLGQLTNLEVLYLSGNQQTTVPESIGQLTNLTELVFFENQLTAIPESIGQLTKLTELRLDSNQLTSLPSSIGKLTRLTRLDLDWNRLTALPESIRQLSKLRTLYLDHNELTALPEWIGQLTELRFFYLTDNQLTKIPESIGQLSQLETLSLSNNQLTEIPESIGQLAKLVNFDIFGNWRLSSPPQEIAAQGRDAVLSFLRALGDSPVERWQSKVLIVGEATVGKTSLSKQLLGEAFDPDERQTHGVRVNSLRLPHPDRAGVAMDLDVWDFGGQLEYRATQRFYLTDRSLFLLVWNSRARAVDGKVIAWLDAVTARAPDSPILVVATHGAEHSPATLPHDLPTRYPAIAGYITVDSRTGLGIDELRAAIARQAAGLPLMGARWPATWDAGARALRGLSGLTVTTHRALRCLAETGVHDPAGQEAIVRVMHDLGQVAYFAGVPDLAEKIILKPEWLDAAITKVIDSPAVTAAGGVLTRAERGHLWGGLADDEDDPGLPDRLIRMMESFDLAYRVGDPDDSDDVALIVDRLPDAAPPAAIPTYEEARVRPGAREIAIIYKLASRQAGIPTWFIAREHRFTTGLHWRHGALLHDRDPGTPAWALLTDDGREQPTITIKVTGTYPVRLFSVLTEAFEAITKARYPGLVEDRLVPCGCQDEAGGRCPHAFTLKELMVEATATEPDADYKIRCPESRIRIEASRMLDGLRGTGIATQFEAINRKLDVHSRKLDAQSEALTAQSSTLNAIDTRQQAALNGIRSLLVDRANAGVHCPALLSIGEAKTGLLRRARVTVTLWCEWPSGPHPLDDKDGSYTFTRIPSALIGYLPYLRYLITALGLAVPALGSVGAALSDQVKDQVELASRTLEFIEKRSTTGALAVGGGSPDEPWHDFGETRARLRVLHDMLQSLDPKNEKNWGNLSPVVRPEDLGTIYLCPLHVHDFDYPYTPGPGQQAVPNHQAAGHPSE